MRTDTQPADTRMMRIVHNALRRDIAHAQSALTRWPYPEPSQRAAIVKHLLWMMQFLRRHHSAEDDGLYPLVRQRVPEAAHVLDAVDADHHALIPEIDKLAHSARRYAQDPSARTELVSALNELAAVMLPHLQREETDMMPVVSAAVTKAEWDAIEQTHAVSPLKPAELAFTGQWLFDEATEADRAVVRSVVPKPVAWAIETFTTRSYQRRAWRCWYLPQHTRLRRKPAGRSAWRSLRRSRRCGSWSPIPCAPRNGAMSATG